MIQMKSFHVNSLMYMAVRRTHSMHQLIFITLSMWTALQESTYFNTYILIHQKRCRVICVSMQTIWCVLLHTVLHHLGNNKNVHVYVPRKLQIYAILKLLKFLNSAEHIHI